MSEEAFERLLNERVDHLSPEVRESIAQTFAQERDQRKQQSGVVDCPTCGGICRVHGMDIQDIIRHRRLALGWTRHRLAKEAKLRVWSVIAAEEGDPPLSTIRRCQAALGILSTIHLKAVEEDG